MRSVPFNRTPIDGYRVVLKNIDDFLRRATHVGMFYLLTYLLHVLDARRRGTSARHGAGCRWERFVSQRR